jgi:hypothetical protein
MNWDAFHQRGEVLRAVVDAANSRRDGTLPTDVPGVAEAFSDEFSLVTELQMRWHTHLSGRIERALMHQPDDLEDAVVAAWRTAAGELAGVRAVLDRYAERPTTPELGEALRRATTKDRVLMAAMAGRTNTADERAARVGGELERRARAGFDPSRLPRVPQHSREATGEHAGEHAADHGSLLRRLKDRLPA